MTINFTPQLREQDALVASGGQSAAEQLDPNIVEVPPREWFQEQSFGDNKHGVRVSEDGRVYGYVCAWHAKHVGLNGAVHPPRSMTNYAWYANKQTLCTDGSFARTGVITTRTRHPQDMKMAAEQANAHYDDTGLGIGDVSVYEDDFGVQLAGAMRPSATLFQMREARGSDWSPDWRPVEVAQWTQNKEMVAIMGCNLSGFITPDDSALVASGQIQIMEAPKAQVAYDVATGEIAFMFGTAWSVPREGVADVDYTALDRRLAALEQAVLSDAVSDKAALEEIIDIGSEVQSEDRREQLQAVVDLIS